MDGLDELEEYMRTARILDVCGFPATTGGAHPRKLVILQGGVGVVAKAADASGGAAEMVPREVAAWLVARALGWGDLLAATVLREIPSASGDIDAAMMVIWPFSQPDVDHGFEEEDRWRAAVFDLIVDQADRSGHNWLAVPEPANGLPKLKLVDHGHCFGYPPGAAVNSTFFNEKQGQELPDRMLEALAEFVRDPPTEVIANLLGADEATRLEERVTALAALGRLQL